MVGHNGENPSRQFPLRLRPRFEGKLRELMRAITPVTKRPDVELTAEALNAYLAEHDAEVQAYVTNFIQAVFRDYGKRYKDDPGFQARTEHLPEEIRNLLAEPADA